MGYNIYLNGEYLDFVLSDGPGNFGEEHQYSYVIQKEAGESWGAVVYLGIQEVTVEGAQEIRTIPLSISPVLYLPIMRQ